MPNSTITIDKCTLINNVFAICMQIIVVGVSLSALFLHKIYIENKQINKRNWHIWCMDNSKQLISSLISHLWATGISIALSRHNDTSSDECAWYILQFLIDTVIGVSITIGLSRFSIYCCHKCNDDIASEWLTIGNYTHHSHSHSKWCVWFVQTIHWVICSIIARIECSYIILLLFSQFNIAIQWFDDKWTNNRRIELLFVILICPCIMNTLQYLTQNWFLFWKRRVHTDINQQLLFSNDI